MSHRHKSKRSRSRSRDEDRKKVRSHEKFKQLEEKINNLTSVVEKLVKEKIEDIDKNVDYASNDDKSSKY